MYGNTALHLAAVNGHADVCVELLWRTSSSLDVLNDDGCTPLDLAKSIPKRL